MDRDLLNYTDFILWLANRGLSTTGTLQELRMRINRLNLYPSLAERKKREKNFSFDTTLNPAEIPPITVPWNTHTRICIIKVFEYSKIKYLGLDNKLN